MDAKDKVRIPEPHKFMIGGGNYGTSCNFVKVYFFDNISKERAEEISHQLMEHITKD